jgi:hypothetical protein
MGGKIQKTTPLPREYGSHVFLWTKLTTPDLKKPEKA